jgi:CRISPR/Cas system-associated exonuclease Cas4 (RecB family)
MNMKGAVHGLSKSLYCKGRQCQKRIWLYNFCKDLAQKTSTFQESILTQGKEVGRLARQLFPSGELIDEDHLNLEGAIKHTQEAFKNNVAAIFEGAFLFNDVLVRVDILTRNDDGTYDLIEVKSSSSQKKEHLPDCAIQAYVLQQINIPLRHICVAYLNKEYVRNGEIDIAKLFIVQPVNEKISDEIKAVPDYLNAISHTLSRDEEPSMNIGAICKNPYTCEFKNYCWKSVTEKSIHYLYSIRDKKRNDLINLGVELIKDIPEDFELSNLQEIQVRCEKTQSKNIDRDSIQRHLNKLQYPLYFLDFETYGHAIPQFNNTRPYQKLVFQFSLHVKKQPDADLEHYEFIFEENKNPSRAMAEKLLSYIGSNGSVIVYHESFERGCIEGMALEFSDLSNELHDIIQRLWDLEIPFAKKWYYDPQFNGSSSIKNVSPVLASDVSYKNLAIQKGDIAQSTYLKFINMTASGLERKKIKDDLLRYCELDTYAMVRILDELQKIR